MKYNSINRTNLILPFFFILTMIFHERAEAHSPYRLGEFRDGAAIGGTAGLMLASMAANMSLNEFDASDISRLKMDDVPVFDRSACRVYSPELDKASDYMVVALAALPAALVCGEEPARDWLTIGVMYAETLGYAGFLPLAAKGLTDRFRPYTYNTSVPMGDKINPDANKSFPSGHTSVAFASAVFLSTVFADYYPESRFTPYIWGLSLAGAAAVGFSRYQSGWHFPTDILTGAAIGSFIGYIIPKIHESENKNLSLLPIAGDDYVGFQIRYSLCNTKFTNN